MVYYAPINLTNGSQGVETLLINESSQISGFGAGLLFFIFIMIVGAGYSAQQRRTGRGNIPMWLASAGLITTTAAFILFLYVGIVDITTVIICMVLSIVFALIFFISPNANE